MYRFILISVLVGLLPACKDAVPGDAPVDDAGTEGGADAAEEASNDGASTGCYVGADCDPTSEVCDPITHECVPYQCNALLPCPSPMVCADQNANAAGGACYPPCDPFAPVGGCPTGQECRSGRIDGTIGLCVAPGSNALGQPCVDSVVSTDCTPGLWCFKTFSSTSICAEPCDYWGDEKLCTNGALRCHPDLACAPLASSLSVDIGEPCAGAPNPLWGCAPDATHMRGLCVQEASGLICRAMCRTALGTGDCQAGESCNPTDYNPILGFCQPA
jgi:hypothetical protein